MAEYAKNTFSNVINIDSLVTLFNFDFAGTICRGEAHNFYEFLYVDKGEHNVTVDGITYTLSEGQMIMYLPLAFHEVNIKSFARVNVASFESSSPALTTLGSRVITLSGKQRQILSQIMSAGVHCFKAATPETGFKGMVVRADADKYELQSLKNMLELFLLDIYMKNGATASLPGSSNYENRGADICTTLTAYLKDNLESALGLSDMCTALNISLSTLKRMCKKVYGMSPVSYLIWLRIEAAKVLINETSLNFTEIAEKTGFSGVHYFSRVFKERVGVSPSEYAKSVYKK